MTDTTRTATADEEGDDMKLDDDILMTLKKAEADMTEAQAALNRALGKVQAAAQVIHERRLPNIQVGNLESAIKQAQVHIKSGRAYCFQVQRGEG